MDDVIRKALAASRESRRIEFKRGFDAGVPGSWCELIKDIVALANSGGGVIVFGLESNGRPSGESVAEIAELDPADVTNKVAKYIGTPSFDVEAATPRKNRRNLYALAISGAPVPHVFERPGTYNVGDGKQKAAFAQGTVYFRHGAKSEPGTVDDIRASMDRAIRGIRKSWMRGIRRVVKAPPGAEVVTVPGPSRRAGAGVRTVRAVGGGSAKPVVLTRDRAKATGTMYYEEVSEGIFDEINNVVDANMVLAKGRKKFLFGHATYYRVYAERYHVLRREATDEMLLRAGVLDFYAPSLFWVARARVDTVAGVLVELYRNPVSPQIHTLLRLTPILGTRFGRWLLGKMDGKWASQTQPPGFYWTFRNIVGDNTATDFRITSSRLQPKTSIELPGEESVSVAELLDSPRRASGLLSRACLMIFEEGPEAHLRSLARSLDYLTYAREIRERANEITAAVTTKIGVGEIGEVAEGQPTHGAGVTEN